MHREIAARCGKAAPVVKHLDGNTLDNRVANLVPNAIIVVPKTALEVRVPPITPVHLLPFLDLTNREFGLFWVIGLKQVGRRKPKDLWLCGCSCGNARQVVIPGIYLRAHETWSCGCSGSNYPIATSASQLIVEGELVAV